MQLISGFDLGALVTVLIKEWISHKTHISKRNFQEKKECYVGLLESYHRAAVEGTDLAAKNFAYWQMRCELVAPYVVRKAIREIVDTNENRKARYLAHENLKNCLRKDMGVSE